MQGVGPHDGLYAAPEGIKPDEGHRQDHSKLKRHLPLVEQEILENRCHQKEPEGSDEHPGEQKEKGTGAVTYSAESLLEILVNGSDLHLVVQGYQHPGNDQVSEEVSHHDLHIGELRVPHPAGNRDKGHPGKGGSDHAKGHHEPWRFPVALEEYGIGVVP